MSALPPVRAYREGLEARDAAGRTLGWILPSVGVQALLTRIAHTDLRLNRSARRRFNEIVLTSIGRPTSPQV